MKNKILYVLTFILALAVLSGCSNNAYMPVVFIEGIGQNKAEKEQSVILELLNKWGAPQSEEIVTDFYDGWDVIGEGEDNKTAEEDTDEALDAMYGEYFTEEGWTYFQSFMLPVTVVATENDAEFYVENIEIYDQEDSYTAGFDIRYKLSGMTEKGLPQNLNWYHADIDFYFKDGRICKMDFLNGMISPQFFVD